jgi:hypothetical protein
MTHKQRLEYAQVRLNSPANAKGLILWFGFLLVYRNKAVNTVPKLLWDIPLQRPLDVGGRARGTIWGVAQQRLQHLQPGIAALLAANRGVIILIVIVIRRWVLKRRLTHNVQSKNRTAMVGDQMKLRIIKGAVHYFVTHVA